MLIEFSSAIVGYQFSFICVSILVSLHYNSLDLYVGGSANNQYKSIYSIVKLRTNFNEDSNVTPGTQEVSNTTYLKRVKDESISSLQLTFSLTSVSPTSSRRIFRLGNYIPCQ